MPRLEGKVSLITGGSTGIGADIARLFAAEGSAIVLGGRRQEPGARLEEELSSRGCDAAFVAADVGTEAGAELIVEEARRRHGSIDVLVLNAGIVGSTHGPFWEVEPAEFDEVFRVNVRGVWLTARAAVPVLPRGATVLVTASMASFMVLPDQVLYSTTKATLIQLARGMALDLAERGIRVNALCPGYTDAGQSREVIGRMRNADEFRARLDAAAPMGRMGTGEEMARAALFLCSDESSFCTGSSLLADGGATIALNAMR